MIAVFTTAALTFSAMIAAPFFIIPEILAGEIGKDYYASLAAGEIALGAAVWCFYYFFIKDYVDELKDHLQSKKVQKKA